jgi:hypothetical protein
MNNSTDPNAKLLADAFHDDWATGPAAGFARHAAARARRRRQVRRVLFTAGAAAMIGAVGFVAWDRRVPAGGPDVASSSAPPRATPRGYEVISDEQLIAQLRDRPLLVVKNTDGTREIVLLTNE